MTHTVLTHVRYHCRTNSIAAPDEVLSILPCFLQREINEQIGARYLMQLDLFRDLPLQIVGQIALSMQCISCNRNKCLYRRSDVAKHIYVQRTGVAYLDYLDGTHRLLRRGDVVGERALFSGRRRYTITTSVWTEFFALNVDYIQHVLQHNFKPRRSKYEWRKMQRMVKDDGPRPSKVERRCELETENGGDANQSELGTTRDLPRTVSPSKTVKETSLRRMSGSALEWLGRKSRNSRAEQLSATASCAAAGDQWASEMSPVPMTEAIMKPMDGYHTYRDLQKECARG